MEIPTESSDAPSEVSLGWQEGAPGKGHRTTEVRHGGDAHEKGTGSWEALCWPCVPAGTLNRRWWWKLVQGTGRATGVKDSCNTFHNHSGRDWIGRREMLEGRTSSASVGQGRDRGRSEGWPRAASM